MFVVVVIFVVIDVESNVFTGQLFCQFGIFEKFGMGTLFEVSGDGRLLTGRRSSIDGGSGGHDRAAAAAAASAASCTGGAGQRRRVGAGAAAGAGAGGRVFDEVHFGEMVTIGAFGNELGITEGTLHDRVGHDGVVARPAEC